MPRTLGALRFCLILCALAAIVLNASDSRSTGPQVAPDPQGCLSAHTPRSAGAPPALAPATPQVTGSCETIIYRGRPETKLDIVFVASHYYTAVGPGSKYAQDVVDFIVELVSFPQFADNINRMNFHRLDMISPTDGCQVTGGTPFCDFDTVMQMASGCLGYDFDNNDQVVVLFDWDNIQPSYAKAEPGVTFLSSTAELVFIHEFGHAFAGLGDEYSTNFAQPNGHPPYPNVAGDDPGFTCSDKWGDLIGQSGVGCYPNAGGTNWYRPTLNDCIMRVAYSSSIDHFGPVCRRQVDGVLSQYDETTAVVSPASPDGVSLGQNVPNPFNPTTSISFRVTSPVYATLEVYDVGGRHIATLFDGMAAPGVTERTWDGVDGKGGEVPSGIYFCRLRAGTTTETRKMVLLK